MNRFLLIPVAGLLLFSACKKDDGNQITDQKTLEGAVLRNFVDGVARPQYNDLAAKSDALYTSLQTLQAQSTDANLTAARTAWKDMRAIWERCEGFLFGPVEDDNYDPYMDTWPTDYVQMDSLLASSGTLTLDNIQNITLSLRGFHPIEYILFGTSGTRTADGITARQKEYMMSLATDLRNNCHALADSWEPSKGSYGNLIITAGAGSSKYATRREVFQAIADGLAGICEEVGEGKMEEPFIEQNAQKVESPYSGNSTTDFRNNILGLQNVYLGRYTSDGEGLNDIVALSNTALDNKLQSQIAEAIASFDNITKPYEQAIFSQPNQIKQTQTKLAALKTTLENELIPFINTNIKD